MRVELNKGSWALEYFDVRVLPKGADHWKCAIHELHTTTATPGHVELRGEHHEDRWALMKFDSRVVPKGAEHSKCGLHV